METFGLDQKGVAVLGEVPAGLPSLVLPSLDPTAFGDLFGAAAGLVLVSFTSGVLTAKSFARRNGYEINAFIKHQKAKGLFLEETYTDEQTTVSPHWQEAVQPPRQEKSAAVPIPIPPDHGTESGS